MLDKLKEIITRVMPGVNVDGVSEDTRIIEDLNFDSLAVMMMSMEIEDAFDFRFTGFVKFETVGDVCKYLEDRIK